MEFNLNSVLGNSRLRGRAALFKLALSNSPLQDTVGWMPGKLRRNLRRLQGLRTRERYLRGLGPMSTIFFDCQFHFFAIVGNIN